MTEPTLDSLRQAGHDQWAPERFRYLESLAARLPGQPAAVRQILAQRLQAALSAYAAQAEQFPKEAGRAHPGQTPENVSSRATLSPLAQLNRELQARTGQEPGAAMGEDDTDPVHAAPLKSAQAFAEVWSKVSAEQQLAQAMERGPENAGPLNPHKLVLRSLRLMRALSPDYVRRFMAQAEALLWLEQAQAPSQAPAKSRRAPPKLGARVARAKPGRA